MSTKSIPATFWIMGLPSSGKSTLAVGVRERFAKEGSPSLMLDGDELRSGLCRGLGFSEAGRTENLRRAAEIAVLTAQSGISSVVAMITPMEAQRIMIRDILAGIRVIWVWLDCPVEECRRRDVKGLYRRHSEGGLAGLTGADGAFEPPSSEVLRLDTSKLSVMEAVDHIWNELMSTRQAGRLRVGKRNGNLNPNQQLVTAGDNQHT